MASNSKFIGNYHDVVIYQQDIDLFTKNAWLNDTAMNLYGMYVYQTMCDPVDGVLVLDASVVGYLALLDLTQDLDDAQELVSGLQLIEKSVVYFPINNNGHSPHDSGSHWSLLVWRRQESAFEHYDSNQRSNEGAARSIAAKVHALKCSPDASSSCTFESPRCPQQQNGYDCGMYTLLTLEYLCRQESKSPASKDNVALDQYVTVDRITQRRQDMPELVQSLVSSDQEAQAVRSIDDPEVGDLDQLDDQPMKIDHCLYLGSMDAARNMPSLRRYGIQHVVSLLDDLEYAEEMKDWVTPWQEDDVSQCTHFSIQDTLDENIFRWFPSVLTLLDQQVIGHGTNVFIHCMAGRSRSATAVAAWLMVHKKWSSTQALDWIREIRPWIAPNRSFLEQLTLFEAILVSAADNLKLTRAQDLLAQYRQCCGEAGALPELHFHVQFRSDLQQRKKTMTLRAWTDISNDGQSDLEGISKYSTVLATTTTTSSNTKKDEKVGILYMTNVYSTTWGQLCESPDLMSNILQQENMSSLQEFENLLTTQFYPPPVHHACLPDWKCIVFEFQCIAI